MKRILSALLICLIATAASAQSKFFRSCEDIPGVTTVYISKAMLKFAAAGSKLTGCDVNIAALASKLDGIEIVNAEGKTTARLKELAKQLTATTGTESLMRVKDNGETVNMFLRKLDRDRTEFILLAEQTNEFSVIILSGTMTMEEVIAAVNK